MKNTLFYLVIILVLISQVSESQNVRYRNSNDVAFDIYTWYDESKINNKIPVHLLHEDIDLFVKTIEEIGVNPYINLSKDQFYNDITLLKNNVNVPLTRREFLLQFVPVVNDLKLSHTRLLTPLENYEEKQLNDKMNGKYFPVSIEIKDNKLIIGRSFQNDVLPGDEIFSINGFESKAIIDSLYRYAGGATKYSKLMDIQDNFPLLFWWVYNIDEPFRIKVKDSVLSLTGITSDQLKELKSNNNQNSEVESSQYKYSQVDSITSIIRLRDFGILDEGKYYDFLESSFSQLKNKSIKNLIIDVRDHPGGGDVYGAEVVKYLYDQPFKSYSKFYYKKSRINEDFSYMFLYPEDRNNPIMRKAANNNGQCESEHEYGTYYECENKFHNPKPDSIRFTGHVYVLSNYLVYSAGNAFVGLIKDYKIGTIIGTETGQSPSNDGQQCWFFLPNCNVLAGGSTTFCIRPNGDPSTTSGVLPDYEVIQTETDSEKGIDTVMDFTMRLIKNIQ